MAVYLVTGHAGAKEWARGRGVDALALTHLDPAHVGSGDTVIGTLPVHLAAEICARGARYLHLALDLPEDARQRELTAQDMDRFGARLEEYEVKRI